MFSKILVAVALMGVFMISTGASSPNNLIANPGFEQGQDGTPAEWVTVGDVDWVTDEVHTGSRAVRVRAEEGTARVKSNFFEVPPHARLETSAWMKAEDIVGSGDHHELRYTIHAYAADQTTRLDHWDIVSTEGSFDWKQVIGSVIVPSGTKYVVVEVQLDESSGTFWIDEVEARIAQTVPEVDSSKVQPPYLLPRPWKIKATADYMDLGKVAVAIPESNERLAAAVSRYFEEINIPYRFLDPGSLPAADETYLLISDCAEAETAKRLQELFPDLILQDLEDQGYFLSVKTSQPTIYLSGITEQGRFYGLQTLKQLVDPSSKSVLIADIADRPTLSRRGIIMGVQFYSGKEKAITRMSQLKLNFIWNEGSFLNNKFWFQWRVPLTNSEKESLANYLELTRAHFIEPFIAIGPRGEDANHPTFYSSEEEINLVVQKMEDLYGLGFRNFGLAFDDLGNYGQDELFGPDIEFFNNNIAEAHVYFTEQVYQKLTANHADISFMVVPMIYNSVGNLGDQDESYLSAFQDLPLEIGLYSAVEYPSDARTALHLTGRPHLIWDNFWASFYREAPPEFVIPLDRSTLFDPSLVAGYTFLPLLPAREDPSLITWKTAADFAWAPDRYDAEIAFQTAAAQYLNPPNDNGSTMTSWVFIPAVIRNLMDSSAQ